MSSPVSGSRPAGLTLIVAIAALAPVRSQPPAPDPLAFLEPGITLTRGERARLNANEAVARALPGQDGQLAVLAATRLDAPAEALVAWTRAITAFKRSQFVLAIGRFSDPPVLSDLDALTLDDDDVDELRRCRPGDCGVKLSASEIAALANVAAAGGAGWRDAVQRAFRQIVLNRVQAYRVGGLAALPPPADRDGAPSIEEALTAIVERSPHLARVPALANWVRRYPQEGAEVESFFYWSKEHYGGGKPVVGVTHVAIARPTLTVGGPATVVAGKQILATHYSQTSLGLTMALPGGAGAPSYLVYVNRSTLDVLSGMVGKLARGLMERRMARQVPMVVSGLRARLESGPPPATPLAVHSGRSGAARLLTALRLLQPRPDPVVVPLGRPHAQELDDVGGYDRDPTAGAPDRGSDRRPAADSRA